VVLVAALVTTLPPGAFRIHAADTAALRSALTFHASFDAGADADFALGDKALQHAPSMSQRGEAKAGLPADDLVARAPGRGKFGDALQFKKKKTPLVFFHADKNAAYAARDWSGTASFWLSVDPRAELEMGFCDPVQITPRAWNDAAFFVEFEKRAEDVPFRLGAYADYKVWNPADRKWEQIPFNEKPLVTVGEPPFGAGKWTHVVFTWENFNTGKSNGVARLYLDGQPRGALSPREQTFTWDPAKTSVMLGVGYIGLFDELSLFSRALTDSEVAALHRLPKGARDLLK
jgi:hypothetical protein